MIISRNYSRLAIASATALLLTSTALTSANAQSPNGTMYISAAGGVNWMDAEKTTFFGDDEEFHDVKFNPQTGLSFTAALGYEGFFNDSVGFRVEAEGFYNKNNINSSSFELDGEGLEDLDGDVKAYGVLGNLYLTYGGPDARFTPYVGGGIGFVNIDPNVRHPLMRVGGSDAAFAYQLFAGLDLPLESNWTISTEVRYLSSNNGDFVVNTGLEDLPFTSDYSSTSILVKFRYLFEGR